MSGKTLGFLTVDDKGRTTFPKTMRRELGIRSGTQLRVDLSSDGVVELVASELVPRDQLWFHNPTVQAGIAKAEADFREGRSKRTDGPEETQQFLDSLKGRARPGRKRTD